MTAAPNNSRMGRILPDVETVDIPLVAQMVANVFDLESGALDVAGFQARTRALLEAEDPRTALAPWIDRVLTTGQDQTLARRSFPDHDYTLQILHLTPGEVHPLHCHHNVISTQLVLSGALSGREFERVRQLGDGRLCLTLLYDGPLPTGACLQTTDGSRNAHWFAAGETPVALLNFNIRGYETDTFYPLALRPLGRRLLDATLGVDGPYVLAAEIAAEEAYGRFGNKPLETFPMPLPAVEQHPQLLGWAEAAK
jgi:hypothetical protein